MGILDSKVTKLNNRMANKFAKSYGLMLKAKAKESAAAMWMNEKQNKVHDEIMARTLVALPDGKWSGKGPVPKIGDVVNVAVNGIGKSQVLGYWLEYGWTGLVVLPMDPPEWFLKQNGKGNVAVVYGAELNDGDMA